jgi:cytoskeletal protein CcmA (bactofilin family)
LAYLTGAKAVRALAYFQRLVLRSPKTGKEPEMADNLENLDIPKMLARTGGTVPARVTDLPRSSAAGNEPGSTPTTPRVDQTEPRSLIVGRREISLSGDIRSCNRLVVEGSVEATLHECREMEIAESGLFKGNAAIGQAEIRGQFEGELVVSKRLLIRASGHVSGTITYGEIEIERGGKVSGVIQEAGPVPSFGVVRAGE